MDYYSAIKKNKIKPFVATWMNLDSHTELNKSEKNKCHMILFICEIFKNDKNELFFYKLFCKFVFTKQK